MSKRPNGYWSDMSDKRLLEYAKRKYSGMTLSELQNEESGGYGVYENLRKRNLLDKAVELGILRRVKQPNGYWSDMSDKRLLDYLKKNYLGNYIKSLQKGPTSNSALYAALKRRGLIEIAIQKRILISLRPKYGYLKKMSNEELLEFSRKHYTGKTITEIQKGHVGGGGVFKELRDRKLIEVAVEQGILVRTRQPNGFLKEMSDDELMEYTKQNYFGKTLTELRKDKRFGYCACNELRKRGLLEAAVEQGILVRAVQRPFSANESQTESLLEGYLHEN